MEEEHILTEKTEKKISKWTIGFLSVLILGMIGAGGFAAYYYGLNQRAMVSPAEDELTMLVSQVGKLMDLPLGEVPTVATVTDKTKLESQSFFKKSENGDKVLIYMNSGKAILYRPSTKKIVDVTVINVAEQTPTPTPTETVATTETASIEPADSEVSAAPAIANIALYNGTAKKGLTQRQEDVILAGFKGVAILEKETANSTDYKKTLVVDVSGKYADLVASLAKKYKAETGTLPEGERVTTADILIIFGEDQL